MRRKPYFLHRTMREHLLREDAFNALASTYQTEDGLIPCTSLAVRRGPAGYDLAFAANPDVEVFSVPESDSVTDTLVNRPDLWNQSAIRLTYHPSIWGSAPLFGVPFRKAVEIAITARHVKSKYYLPEIHHEGGYESLLLHIRKVDDERGELLQLEAWQYKPGSDFAHYLHAMSPDFQTYVIHLDGATIKYADQDLTRCLSKRRK